jgi:hypothetical protein
MQEDIRVVFEQHARKGNGLFAIAFAILKATDAVDRMSFGTHNAGPLGQIANEFEEISNLLKEFVRFHKTGE